MGHLSNTNQDAAYDENESNQEEIYDLLGIQHLEDIDDSHFTFEFSQKSDQFLDIEKDIVKSRANTLPANVDHLESSGSTIDHSEFPFVLSQAVSSIEPNNKLQIKFSDSTTSRYERSQMKKKKKKRTKKKKN